MTATPGERDYDIAVSGGGMVGLSLLLLIADALPDLRLALLESQPLDRGDRLCQPGFDARSTALASRSVDLLRALGVWPQIVAHATRIRRVHVSDRGHSGSTSYSEGENGGRSLGHVVENVWLGRALIERLKSVPTIDIYAPAHVRGVRMGGGGARLEVACDQGSVEIACQLAIAADGVHSQLREQLGIACDVHDYEQGAVIANVEYHRPHRGVAYERFTADGPLALLPLGGADAAAKSALVWTRPREHVAQTLDWNDETFLRHLQQAFGYRLGKFQRVGKRHHYPLQRVVAREQIRSAFVLMGSAAHHLHPVAGQGFNLALRDCASLVRTMKKTHAAGGRFGSLQSLQNYLRAQQSDQWLTTTMSHGFNLLFCDRRLACKVLRTAGLLGLNWVFPAKKAFFDQMMGKGTKNLRFV